VKFRMTIGLVLAGALLGGCKKEPEPAPAPSASAPAAGVAPQGGANTDTAQEAKDTATEAIQSAGEEAKAGASEVVEQTKAVAEQAAADISRQVRDAAEQYLKGLGEAGDVLSGVNDRLSAAGALPRLQPLVDSIKSSYQVLIGAGAAEQELVRKEFGERFAAIAATFRAEMDRLAQAGYPKLAELLKGVPLYK